MARLSFFERRFVEQYFNMETWHNGARTYWKLRPWVTYGTAKLQAHRILQRPRVLDAVELKWDEIRGG